MTFVLFPFSAVLHPCDSLKAQAPYPKCSFFPLLPHILTPVPGHWCLLCFSSRCSAVSSFWPLCSASPQILSVQLPDPVLNPMNFSVGFLCSPAQLLLSGFILLHPDLRKIKLPSLQFPLLNLMPQKLLQRYEVWGIYKVFQIP